MCAYARGRVRVCVRVRAGINIRPGPVLSFANLPRFDLWTDPDILPRFEALAVFVLFCVFVFLTISLCIAQRPKIFFCVFLWFFVARVENLFIFGLYER